MSKKDSLIKYLIQNGGKLQKGETWFSVGELFGFKPLNKERALKDRKYYEDAVSKRANDVWRKHKKKTIPRIVPKRLFYDIETSYNIGKFWRAGYGLNITPTDIIVERKIICVSYKWQGEEEVKHLKWDDSKRGFCKQDDKKLVQELVKILNEADEIVAHNGDRYDETFIRTRALYHNIPMKPKYNSYDTLKKARKHFKFNSNKLDYIASFLGFGNKNKTSMKLWDDIILDNSKVAMDEMIAYCDQDVILLEKVFFRILDLTTLNTNHSAIAGIENSCPECGDTDFEVSTFRVTMAGTKKYMLKCKCGCSYNISSKKLKSRK